MISMLKRPVLMLYADFQAYDATTVKESFGDVYSGRANFVDEMYMQYDLFKWINIPVKKDEDFILTPKFKIKVPEVIRFKDLHSKELHKRRQKVVWNRKNLWKRDGGRCQFCGRKPKPDEITVDHLVPRSRGGISCFENCVLACIFCNLKKAGRTPEEAGMRLRRLVPNGDGTARVEYYDRPKRPKWSMLYNLPRITKFPKSWKNFLRLKNEELYWEVELKGE